MPVAGWPVAGCRVAGGRERCDEIIYIDVSMQKINTTKK